MKCKFGCGSRILDVSGKPSDRNFVIATHLDAEKEGYVPYGLGIGGGDYIEFELCLDCGRIQSDWPIDDSTVIEALG